MRRAILPLLLESLQFAPGVPARAPSGPRRRLIHARLRHRNLDAPPAPPMRFWESGWIDIARHDIPIGLREPLRVLHLSDLHASRVVSLGYLERVFELGLEHKPHLICLTGDFITWKYNAYDPYAAALKRLSRAAPTFACLGNHDGGPWAGSRLGYASAHPVRRLLRQAGVTLLHNRGCALQLGSQCLNLVGVGDPWNDECHPEAAFATPLEPGAPTVVLSHNPDTKTLLAPFHWSLMLSGHTPGGQWLLPGLGALLAPVRDKHRVRGLHLWRGRWVYITKGVGNLHGLRLNCRPEAALLTLS